MRIRSRYRQTLCVLNSWWPLRIIFLFLIHCGHTHAQSPTRRRARGWAESAGRMGTKRGLKVSHQKGQNVVSWPQTESVVESAVDLRLYFDSLPNSPSRRSYQYIVHISWWSQSKFCHHLILSVVVKQIWVQISLLSPSSRKRRTFNSGSLNVFLSGTEGD